MAYSGAVYSFQHNWQHPVTERLSWLTNVLPRKSNTEQRISLRKHPRRTIEYKTLVSDRTMRARFDAFMELYQGQLVMAPAWMDAERLATSASGTSISLATASKDYDAGTHVMLWRNYTTYEVIEIDAVAADELTLSEAIVGSWGAGDVVMPARLAYLSDTTASSQMARDIRDGAVVFEFDPILSPSVNRFVADTPLQYQSLDFYPNQSESSITPAFDTTIRRVQNDFETGAIGNVLRETVPTSRVEHRRLMKGREEVAAFLNFLSRRKGRQRPFWTPAYGQQYDFISEVLNTFRIADEMYKERFDAGKARPHFIRRFAGDLRGYKTQSVTKDGSDELISVSSDAEIEADTVLNIGSQLIPLRYSRLESDAVELSWLTSTAVDVRLNFREMFAEAP